jgi:hypothetical protein
MTYFRACKRIVIFLFDAAEPHPGGSTLTDIAGEQVTHAFGNCSLLAA